jgi:hypothetical protein
MKIEYVLQNADNSALRENLGKFGFRIFFPLDITKELAHKRLDFKVKSEFKKIGDIIVEKGLGSSFHKNLVIMGLQEYKVFME